MQELGLDCKKSVLVLVQRLADTNKIQNTSYGANYICCNRIVLVREESFWCKIGLVQEESVLVVVQRLADRLSHGTVPRPYLPPRSHSTNSSAKIQMQIQIQTQCKYKYKQMQKQLLAPQSGALKISAYRDFQSHPIPSIHPSHL